MAEDAEKKNIAKLDFDINNAINKLDKIDEKLKKISETSEAYANKIGDNLSKAINSGMIIDTQSINKNLNKTTTLSKDNAERLSVQLQKTEAKKQAQMTIQAQKGEQDRQTAAYKSALKQEEYNNRVLKSTQTLYDKISDYAKTYLIYQGFNQLKQGIQETIDEMVEVEYQMVQIDRVLNDSSLNIDNYRDKLIQLAYDYGNSFNNVADITLRLAQAGFNAEESLKLTEKTLLALNTAELNATQATSDMVAVMAQWGLMTGTASEQAKSYGDIIDKINKVADNFPTTSEDILNALKKTSSAFNLAGASIDETIATIVTAEKVSQRGGKVIGTALSNIIQQLKDAGRLTTVESLGIDVYTDATKTEFKSVMDILSQLSEKMQQLKNDGKENSLEMQNLLEVFTVFRRNIGAGLLSEMAGEDSTYAEVLKTSIDSVGYSIQENEKHMQTAKAAQEQFNTTLLELKTSVWDGGVENVFRSMLLLGNDVTNAMKFLIDTFGTIPTALGAATLAFTVFNKNMKIAEVNSNQNKIQFSGLIKQIKEATIQIKAYNKGLITADEVNNKIGKGSLKNYIQSLNGATASTKSYTMQVTTATIKTIGLEAATIALNAALSLGLSAAITLIISGINNLIHAEEKEQEKFQESIDKHNEKISSYKSETEEIDNLIKKYEELSSADANTPENLKQIQELKIKINSLLAQEGKSVLDTNDNYNMQLAILKDISKEKLRSIAQEQKAKMQETLEANKGVKYKTPTGSNIMLKPTKENIGLLQQELTMMTLAGKEGTKAYETIKEKVEELKRQLNENNEVTSEYINSLAELKLQEWFPEGTIENAEQFEEILKKISGGEFNFSNVLGSFPEDLGLTGDQLEQFKSILLALVKNEYAEFNAETELASGNLSALDSVLKSHLTSLQNLSDQYAMLRTAQDEYNKTGALTISTLQGLIDNKLLQYLSIQNGQLKINAQSMLDLAEATKVKAIESLKDAASTDIEKLAIGDVKNMSSIAKGAIAQFGDNSAEAGNKAQTASGKILELAASIDAAVKAGEGNLSEGLDVETFKKQAKAIGDAYMGIAKNISSINIKTATYKPQTASGSSSAAEAQAKRAAEQAAREAEKAAEEAKKAEEEAYKARLSAFEDYVKEKERLEKRWVDKQKELGQLSNDDYLYIIQQRIERYKKYLKEVENATWMHEEDKLELIKEYSEKIEDLQVDYLGYIQDQLDDEIDALKKGNEEKIQLIKDEADARINALRKVEDENDRIRAKEEYEKKRAEHLEDISYWEQRTGRQAQEALKEAKKNLQELDEEWQQQQEDWKIEDQIAAIEKERDAQIKAIEDAQETEIASIKAAYEAKVKLFAETGQIIYNNSVIQSQALYNAYKTNFIDPVTNDLNNLNKAAVSATTSSSTAPTTQQYETYLIKSGDTLSKIAKRYGTTVEKIMAANPYITNKNKIYAGKTLQIPKFHEGGIFGGNYEEGLALLKKGEVILKPTWAASLDRMMKHFDNLSAGNTTNISNGSNIEVKGDLIKIEANVRNQTDIDAIGNKIEKILKDKFNIRK